MKTAKNIFAILLSVLALSSCQDVVDLDLPEGEKRIIINGRVTDSIPVEVNIYATIGYLSDNPNPTVSNAIVTLFENNIAVAQLTESVDSAGYYTAPFLGTEGNSYRIEVEIPNGAPHFSNTRWTSTNETLSRVFPIDSVYSKFEPEQPFIEEGYYTYFMFTEPQGKGDNYRIKIWKNDSAFASQFDISVISDDLLDGYSFDDTAIPAVQFGDRSEVGDTVRVEVSSISFEGYKFLNLLQEQTVQVGSTFDPPPAPIFGNISNADDPSILGLGYFFASKTSTASIIIEA